VAAAAAQGEPTAVFITPKSLVTFPVASSAVTVVWLLIQQLFGNWGKSPWVPVGVALVLGFVIFAASVSDANVRPKSGAAWFVSIFVGGLNSLYLAASAIGILRR